METPSASPYLHDKGNDKEWNHRGGCTPPCNIGCAAHPPWCTLLWPQEGKTTCDWGGLLPRLLQHRPFQTSDPLGPRSRSISPLDKGIFSQLAAYNRIPSMGRQPASGWGQPHCYRIHYLLEYSIYMPCTHQGFFWNRVPFGKACPKGSVSGCFPAMRALKLQVSHWWIGSQVDGVVQLFGKHARSMLVLKLWKFLFKSDP